MRTPDPFTIDDIERGLKALFPTTGENPFENIEDKLLEAREEFEKSEVITEAYRKKTADQLDDIESRTFGILLLQIFSTLRFFFRLLPQGRLILLVVAGIGLIQTLLSDGTVSVETIKQAVAASGLQVFVDRVIESITAIVKEQASHASELADTASQVFVSIAGKGEGVERAIEAEIQRIRFISQVGETPTVEEMFNHLGITRAALRGLLPDLAELTNAASNSALVLGPALRRLDDGIEDIPALALKLVRLS